MEAAGSDRIVSSRVIPTIHGKSFLGSLRGKKPIFLSAGHGDLRLYGNPDFIIVFIRPRKVQWNNGSAGLRLTYPVRSESVIDSVRVRMSNVYLIDRCAIV
jgi:hypothetical protein